MPQETSGNWANSTKNSDSASSSGSNVKVIRREQPKMSKGQVIMQLADRMLPGLMEFFKDKRDKAGMLIQPAHVRGFALNMAENLVKNRELKENNNA